MIILEKLKLTKMKKLIYIFAIGLSLMSCSAEPLEPIKEIPQQVVSIPSHTFTVAWASNQESPYVIFRKYTFKDCKLTETYSEVHREKIFDVTLENGQIFEIDVRREASVKNPDIYLSIFKGAELQYEQEVESNGFLLQTFIDGNGNVKDTN